MIQAANVILKIKNVLKNYEPPEQTIAKIIIESGYNEEDVKILLPNTNDALVCAVRNTIRDMDRNVPLSKGNLYY